MTLCLQPSLQNDTNTSPTIQSLLLDTLLQKNTSQRGCQLFRTIQLSQIWPLLIIHPIKHRSRSHLSTFVLHKSSSSRLMGYFKGLVLDCPIHREQASTVWSCPFFSKGYCQPFWSSIMTPAAASLVSQLLLQHLRFYMQGCSCRPASSCSGSRAC